MPEINFSVDSNQSCDGGKLLQSTQPLCLWTSLIRKRGSNKLMYTSQRVHSNGNPHPRFPVMRIVFCHLGVHKETWERNSYFLAHQAPNLTYITVHAVTQLSEEHISVFPRHREETCFKMPESCNGEPETAQAVALSAASLSTLLKPSSQTLHSTLAITPTWQNRCSCLLFMVDFCRVLEVKQLKPIFVNGS